MSFAYSFDNTLDKPAFYAELAQAAQGLMFGEKDRIANAANFSALIFNTLVDVNWAGFYFYDGTELVVGPFQGLPACIRIPLGKGVCGTAAQIRQPQLVEDVNQFPGHIACDSASQSEIVIPLLVNDELMGVFDIDSPNLAHLSGMEKVLDVFRLTLSE